MNLLLYEHISDLRLHFDYLRIKLFHVTRSNTESIRGHPMGVSA
jgi:hypothetical protein